VGVENSGFFFDASPIRNREKPGGGYRGCHLQAINAGILHES